MTQAVDVVVLGAGLTGLSATYALQKQGYSVVLVEQSDRVGGVIQTVHDGGFQLELGPNTFLSSATAINQLATELNLSPVSTAALAKKRYIYCPQGLQPVPMSPLSFFTTPLLSPAAKVRLLAEPMIPPQFGHAHETVAAFVKRRLGQEVLDMLMGPFISGVYAGDPERLSIEAVFPKLVAMETDGGSLLNGAIRLKRQAKQKGAPSKRGLHQLLSFAEGMESLPKAIASSLVPNTVVLANGVVALSPQAIGGWQVTLSSGNRITASSVVSTLPAYVATTLFQPVCSPLASLFRQIEYVPMAVVHVAFRRQDVAHPMDGFGCLVPRKANVPTLGAIWNSSLFSHVAPSDTVLMTCFIGGATLPQVADWTDENVVETVLADITQLLSIQQPPLFCRLTRWPQAIPQYTLGHNQRVKELDTHLEGLPGLFLAGNFLSGVSVNDCVLQGQAAAQKVSQFLPKATLCAL